MEYIFAKILIILQKRVLRSTINMEFKIKSFLTFLSVNFFILQSFGWRSCFTAREEFGHCRGIKSCPFMLNIVQMIPLHPEHKTYLRHSQCSNDKESQKEVIICCPFIPLPLSNKTLHLTYHSVLPAYCRFPNPLIHVRMSAHGNSAKIDEYPWMALVEYESPHGSSTLCSASLISERYVLSAAHCFCNQTLPLGYKAINIRLGEYDTSKERDCTPTDYEDQWIWDSSDCADPVVTIPIETITIHKDYRNFNGTCINDMALLRLAQPVTFTKYIKPICLPQNSYVKQWLFTAGWGLTENGVPSDKKLKVQVPSIDMHMCASILEPYKFKPVFGMFCTERKDGKGSCKGDSGGPIMAKTRIQDDEKWVLYGIDSFGSIHCGYSLVPQIYAKVYDFLPWIFNNLRA